MNLYSHTNCTDITEYDRRRISNSVSEITHRCGKNVFSHVKKKQKLVSHILGLILSFIRKKYIYVTYSHSLVDNYNRVKCNTFQMQCEIYINSINFSGILEHYR